MNDAAARSPSAGSPDAPSAPGFSMVPEASMMARARMSSSPCLVCDANDVCGILPAAVLHPVVGVTRHGDDPRVEPDMGRELRRRRERLEILLDEVVAGRGLVRRRHRPALPRRAAPGGRVDAELPRREHPHVAPTANTLADSRARFEDERRHSAGTCALRQPDQPGRHR